MTRPPRILMEDDITPTDAPPANLPGESNWQCALRLGHSRWYCYGCKSEFKRPEWKQSLAGYGHSRDPASAKAPYDTPTCPECGSTNVDREKV